jgi:hypothetical protein
MSVKAAIGQSWAVDGHQAGLEAARQAVDQLGRAPVAFAWMVVSHSYQIDQALAGVTEVTGDAPILGFSTSAALGNTGRSRRSVIVGLLSGENIRGRSGWWSEFSQDGQACTQKMLAALHPDPDENKMLLVVADGLGASADLLCSSLADLNLLVSGCLASGDLVRGRTYQVGGRQSGSGGLAAAVLSGDLVIGVGAAHGWQPFGALTRVTRLQGQWVRLLDNQLPSEVYAHYFGYTARQWVYPPLNSMVRLYPLGFSEGENFVLRSPIRVEADGSLRMNTSLVEGALADLMVGTQAGCVQACRQAAQQALSALGEAAPCLAVLLVDAAWEMLLELEPECEVNAVREILGKDIPILGGYTLGQIASVASPDAPDLYNQHIAVLLFGSPGFA